MKIYIMTKENKIWAFSGRSYAVHSEGINKVNDE